MILKIRYKPLTQYACWVYVGNIKTLEFHTIDAIPEHAHYDSWYVNKEDCTKKTACECKLCNENRGFGIIVITFNNGQMETYVIDRTAFLLNETGGTVEKLSL